MSFLAAQHVGSISVPAAGKEEEADEYQPLEKAQLEYTNLTSMSRLHELNVVENLNHRYLKKPPQIYTSINNILLAVNPYQDLGIYSSKHITKHAKGDGTKDPHIYSIANRAYRQLIRDQNDQSILICGESGSGKTETAKYAMRFLTSIGPKGKSDANNKKKKAKDLIEQQIVAVNPVLEAFGNAKTTMNNNSSRFAKFTQILFSKFKDDPKAKTIAQQVRSRAENTHIVGSAIQTYLLEKPRVVRQAENEKNFHVFYQIFHLPKAKLDEYGLTKQADFKYLGDGKTQTNWVEGQQNMYTKKSFEETCNSMKTLGFTAQQSEEMFRCVAGVLHLGNIMFGPEGQTDRDAQVDLTAKDKHHLGFAARLFGIDEEGLTDRMTMELMKAGRDVHRIPYTVHKALSNRDSIARNIYEGVFNYLVKGLNKTLHKQDEGDFKEEEADRAGGQPYIGVLDVFGFENFTVNSFEQYCINYANETLQQLFDKTVIGDERLEYIKEGVFWGDEESEGMDKGNSEICLVLLDKVYHSLDEQCRMDRTAENFVSEIHSTIASDLDDLTWLCLASAPPRKMKGGLTPNALSPRASGMASPRSPGGRTPRGHRRSGSSMMSKETFRIQHYAGEVAYTATQFLVKNKDRVVVENAQLFGTSEADLVKLLFASQAAKEPQQGRKRKKAKGIGGVFRDQMSSLMGTLVQTGCYFVRCLNPNNQKKKGKFDDEYIGGQLRAGGIVAALEVIKKGYPTRKEFQAIKDIFENCKPLKKQHEKMGARDFVQFLLIVFKDQVPESCYRLGNSKLFFKPGQADKLDLLSESTESISKKQVAAAESWFKAQRLVKLRGFARASGVMIKTLRYRRMRAKVQPLCHGIIFMGSMALAQKKRYDAADTIKTWYRTRSEEKNFSKFMEFCASQLSASGDFSDMSQDDKIDALAEASTAKWGIERQEEPEAESDEEAAGSYGGYDQEADEDEESRNVRFDDEDGEAGDSDADQPKKKSSSEKTKKSGVFGGFFGGSSKDESEDETNDNDDDGADERRVSVRGGSSSSSGGGSGGGHVSNEAVDALMEQVQRLEAKNNELAASQLRLAESLVRMRKGGNLDAGDDDPISDLDEHVRRLTELTSGIDSTKMAEWQPLKKPGRTSGDLVQTIFLVLLVVQVVLLVVAQIPHAHNPRYAMLKAAEEFRPYYTHVMDNYVSSSSS